jgi:hypothetical protein
MPYSSDLNIPLAWNDGDTKGSRPQTMLHRFHFVWKEVLLLVLAVSTTVLSIAVFNQDIKAENLASGYSA